jgi:2-C-methyl-D-erythritol 4-phosphate cytidylyltransferase
MYKEGKTEGVTDDAMVVSAFGKVEPYLTKSSYKNIKVTTPEDLSIAECFLKIK